MVEGVVYETDDAIIQTVPDATHANPDLWPRATEFLPDRFVVPAGDPLYPRKNAWRPFELGTTRCMGEELVMIQIKLALVMTLRDLDFEFGVARHDPTRYVIPLLILSLLKFPSSFCSRTAINPLKHNNSASLATPNKVNGDHIYSVGEGLGQIKGNLPTRVRMRL